MSAEDGLSCDNWGSALCGPLCSRLAGECSHGDGRGSRGNPATCKTASLVKASHLPEAKVKEWAGHPAQDGKAKLHSTDIGNNE